MKSWLETLTLTKGIYYLFITSIVATCLDIVSTGIALGIWLDPNAESVSFTSCMISQIGLGKALITLFCLRISFSYLLYNSLCRNRVKIVGLLALTCCGFYLGIVHFYYIVQIIMV